MFTTFSSIQQSKVISLTSKNSGNKMENDIGRDGYWKPHVSNSSALAVPKISKAVAAQKKNRDTE
jgi:hypothetical protein